MKSPTPYWNQEADKKLPHGIHVQDRDLPKAKETDEKWPLTSHKAVYLDMSQGESRAIL